MIQEAIELLLKKHYEKVLNKMQKFDGELEINSKKVKCIEVPLNASGMHYGESLDEYLERIKNERIENEKKFEKMVEEMEKEVVGKPLTDYTDAKGAATLEYRTGIKDHCAAYDPFGLCNIMDCLKCENAYYKITLPDGSVVANTNENLNAIDNTSRGFEDDDHLILFYDRIPTKCELLNYLEDYNSQYRTVRLCDNMCMNDYVGEYNRAKRLEKKTNKNK